MRTPLLQPRGLQPSSSEHMRTAVLLNNPNYITCYISITYHRIYISSLLHIYILQPQLLIRSPDNCRAQLQITQICRSSHLDVLSSQLLLPSPSAGEAQIQILITTCSYMYYITIVITISIYALNIQLTLLICDI